MTKRIIDLIYQEYYGTVLGYCITRLNGDIPAAEDCTQEVFYILQKKIKQLIQLESVLPWLLATADREIKSYKRKHPQNLSIDEIPEQAAPEELRDSVLDILDDEDRRLAELYYGGADKEALAKSLGISTSALYMRMYRIRQIVKAYLENPDK